MTEPLEIVPLPRPPDVTISLPGSKSITNRALVCAALAHGRSRIEGALVADDTEAMADCLGRLGFELAMSSKGSWIELAGASRPPASAASLDARLSGTTARFVLPVLGLGRGRYRLDGAESLRARPMGPSIEALRTLGARVTEEGAPGHLPVVVEGSGLDGGRVVVPGDASSQFVSGLLLAGPGTTEGLEVVVAGQLVSRPFVELTVAVMRSFGASVTSTGDGWQVAPGGYRATVYPVEPDATAASYFFAAAAITGGRVTVSGLGRESLQGDLAFVDVLEQMGAKVDRQADTVTVTGTGRLEGVDVDLGHLTDTAQTLAAVAVFAEGPTRIRGIGFIRAKETDRVGHPVRELRRLGVRADEEDDGFVVHPGTPRPGVVETYDDHRMAMSFALLGLRVPGIRIADPGCVAKTFPGYWETLGRLAG